MTATSLSDAPAGSMRGADVVGERIVQVAQRDEADLTASQPALRPAPGSLSEKARSSVELALEVVDLRALLIEVAARLCSRSSAVSADDVGAEAGADQDPDGQRQEDGRQRGGVVASGVAHTPDQRCRARP